MSESFLRRYGPWALVAGASEGLGAAWAEALARRGLNLILLARRKNRLEEMAARLTKDHGIQTRVVVADLASPRWQQKALRASHGLDIGLAVYNAAASIIGPFLARPLEDSQGLVEVNIAGPMRLVHHFAPAMVKRGRGGIILMSSLAGFQGSPRLAAYAGSKAFNTSFGESLWAELKPSGVDVLVVCAGAIRTPNYASSQTRSAPGTQDPAEVVAEGLAALGRRPTVVTGRINRLARLVLGRLLPRRWAIDIMDKNTRGLT